MEFYDFLRNFISGGVAGVTCMVTGHPFDTVKVRLQTMPKPEFGTPPIFTGTFDCFYKTVTKEGFFALFKGLAVPVVFALPRSAIFFGCCALGKRLQTPGASGELSLVQNFNAGAFGSCIRATLMIPTERIKCLLQVQRSKNLAAGSPYYNGPVDAIKKLYKTGGIRSIYRGSCATLLRDIPGGGSYLAVYELLKRLFLKEKAETKFSPLVVIAAGGTAGLASCTLVIPADVLKSRIQTAPEGKYKYGTRSALYEILHEEGFKALFKGFTPVALRAFPANAACFLGLEVSLSLFRFFEG